MAPPLSFWLSLPPAACPSGLPALASAKAGCSSSASSAATVASPPSCMPAVSSIMFRLPCPALLRLIAVEHGACHRAVIDHLLKSLSKCLGGPQHAIGVLTARRIVGLARLPGCAQLGFDGLESGCNELILDDRPSAPRRIHRPAQRKLVAHLGPAP